MTRARIIAGSPHPLAGLFIDRLRAGIKPGAGHAGKEPEDLSHQPGLPFADVTETVFALPVMRPDEAAAAILLGRELDRNREALARLQDRDAVTIIEVPTAEFIAPVERILRSSIVGTDAPIITSSEMALSDTSVAIPGTVALFKKTGETRIRDETTEKAFVIAIQRRCAVVVIADPIALLPADLVRIADNRIVIPAFDPPAVEAVIEAFTGRHPGPVEAGLCDHLTLQQLMVGVRSDLGPQKSVARLDRMAKKASRDATALPLSALHGLGAAKTFAEALVADLRSYAENKIPWSAVDKGCLISGPPGTGKTTLARAMALEAGFTFISASYSAWQSNRDGHLGSVLQAMRKTFADARRDAPAIVFIDEIDTIRARGTGGRNDDWWSSITNCLLEELDGFDRREGVVVMAATNNPDTLDRALTRPGRLDRLISLSPPSVPDLAMILRTHLGPDLVGANLMPAAVVAAGATGAEIERYVRDARNFARRAGRAMTLEDVIAAVRDGRPALSEDMRRHLSVHESGHALARILTGVGQPVAVSINDRGGVTQSEREEIEVQTLDFLKRHMIAILAGRAAEDVVFGVVGAGAGGSAESDLARATEIATKIELSWGLGRFGPMWLSDAPNHRELILSADLRGAVRSSHDAAYAAAIALMSAHRPTLDALASALSVTGYLGRDEIEAICETSSVLTPANRHTTLVPADDVAANTPTEVPRVSS